MVGGGTETTVKLFCVCEAAPAPFLCSINEGFITFCLHDLEIVRLNQTAGDELCVLGEKRKGFKYLFWRVEVEH